MMHWVDAMRRFRSLLRVFLIALPNRYRISQISHSYSMSLPICSYIEWEKYLHYNIERVYPLEYSLTASSLLSGKRDDNLSVLKERPVMTGVIHVKTPAGTRGISVMSKCGCAEFSRPSSHAAVFSLRTFVFGLWTASWFAILLSNALSSLAPKAIFDRLSRFSLVGWYLCCWSLWDSNLSRPEARRLISCILSPVFVETVELDIPLTTENRFELRVEVTCKRKAKSANWKWCSPESTYTCSHNRSLRFNRMWHILCI